MCHVVVGAWSPAWRDVDVAEGAVRGALGAKTWAWIVASTAGIRTCGVSGVTTVTRSSSGVLPASALRS